MQIIKTIAAYRDWYKAHEEESIGLVPTMGYLHEGHLSLVRASKNDCDRTVVSIFVNPTQFAPGEDLDTYPRDLERDLALLEPLEVDVVFVPSVEEMYPDGTPQITTKVSGPMSDILCGASRPHFFGGVTTVVAKLFHILTPTKGFFGLKDYQQTAILKRMVKDLNFPVEIVGCPIVREEDGLAMSSRNAYLNEEERRQALSLSKGLDLAEKMIREGEKDPAVVREAVGDLLAAQEAVRTDYIEIVDGSDLRRKERIEGDVLVALAAWVGKPRLIDNRLIKCD